MSEELKIYGDSRSGNCYKIQLLCAELGIPYAWQDVDILAGESRTPEFLAMNPNGRVPLLALPDGTCLAESNAILCYLADGHAFAGSDRIGRAQVLQWLFFEQYSHEPYIATVRFWIKYLGKQDEWKDKIAETMKKGYAALDVMEKQLEKTPFIAGAQYSVADIALYAYTAVASDGGYDLKNYPGIRAWFSRVESIPGFFLMSA